MYRILLLSALSVLFLFGCTPTETNDLVEFEFSNQTEYRNYMHANNWLVNFHPVYAAKIYKNGVLISDTNRFVNNAILFCVKNDANNPNWKFIKTFGNDSLAVVLRTPESAHIRYRDSLIYQLLFSDLNPTVIDTNMVFMKDSTYKRITNASDIREIDSAMVYDEQFMTYAKWQETVKKRYCK